MGTAQELAQQALRIAADLRNDQIEGFEWTTGLIPNFWRVTLNLTDGQRLTYIVMEEKERNTPSGEFHLW